MDLLVIRNPGIYHWRSGGEKHINDPASIASLQVTNFENLSQYFAKTSIDNIS